MAHAYVAIPVETPVGVFRILTEKRGAACVVVAAGFGTLPALCAQLPEAPSSSKIEVVSAHPYADVVRAFFNGDQHALQAVHVDQEGTPFQKRVWDALRDIPYGTTVTYRTLAERVGNNGAVRAVGSACGANRIMLFIPCHRVVRSDGKVGVYRYGEARKKKILALEQHRAH